MPVANFSGVVVSEDIFGNDVPFSERQYHGSDFFELESSETFDNADADEDELIFA